MSLSFALSSFLKAVDRETDTKPIPNGGVLSRSDLIRLIRENVDSAHAASELIDTAAYEGFLDARNKRGPVFEDFYLTELGREFLASPETLQERGVNPATSELIDSTDWTGLAKRISPKQKGEIRAKANELLALIIQSDADEGTRLDACKRVEAVICLLEAPNSPWRDIVALLTHPVLQTFFASTSLIRFIVGIAR